MDTILQYSSFLQFTLLINWAKPYLKKGKNYKAIFQYDLIIPYSLSRKGRFQLMFYLKNEDEGSVTFFRHLIFDLKAYEKKNPLLFDRTFERQIYKKFGELSKTDFTFLEDNRSSIDLKL